MIEPSPFRSGVLGAGVVGSGIAQAQVLAVAEHHVVCHDVAADVLHAAGEAVDTGSFGVRGAVRRGTLTTDEADAALARIHVTDDRPMCTALTA